MVRLGRVPIPAPPLWLTKGTALEVGGREVVVAVAVYPGRQLAAVVGKQSLVIELVV